MRNKLFFLTFLALFCPVSIIAEDKEPSVTATAVYIDSKGDMKEETSKIENGEAPLEVTFRANPSNMGNYSPSFEWHFKNQNDTTDILVRYEEETVYTFTSSGTFYVTLVTKLDNDTELASQTITVIISESRLEFPNAFSPNGDDKNEIYGAKGVNDPESPAHYKSIVEFHAYIFNRWGQKLYEWTDVSKGWDGTYKGHPVKQGVYFVLVKAKGADGREYNIRKDVNLLRGYTEEGSNNSSEETTP